MISSCWPVYPFTVSHDGFSFFFSFSWKGDVATTNFVYV